MGATFAAGSLLLATALLAPFALAHGGWDAGAPLGESSLHLRILGAPAVAAGAPLRMEAATDAALPLEARLVDPRGAAGAWFPLRAEGALARADVSFLEAGDWRVEVRAGLDLASFDLHVWPAGPAFVEPASVAAQRGVVVHGSDEPLALQLVDAGHAPLTPPADARARVASPDGARELPLAEREGLLVLATGDLPLGAHEVEILSESLRLAPGSRPPVGVLVVAPEDADVYGLDERRGVPAGGVAWAALALAGAALARAFTRERP